MTATVRRVPTKLIAVLGGPWSSLCKGACAGQVFRTWWTVCLLAVTLWGAGGTASAAERQVDIERRAGTSKPNVIWILLDACRVNLSCYGYERQTSPNIDEIASRGVLFEQNFAQSVETISSVPSYMTGRYFPVAYLGEYGVFEQYRNVQLPPEEEQLLPEIFEQNGYETAMVTIADAWFSLRDRLPRAFGRFIGVTPRIPPLPSFEELNVEVTRYISSQRDKPFFLYVHTWDTHFPHYLDPPYDRWLDRTYDAEHLKQSNRYGAKRADGQRFSEADKQYLRGLHDGSILFADTHISVLIEALEQRSLLENTLIIVGADHGEALGEDGETVAHAGAKTYDEVIHVPLIIAGPGLPHGKRVSCVTENADIAPTLVDFLGLTTDAEFDGKSLVPVTFDSNAPAPHRYAFVKDSSGSLLSLRGDRFKYEYNVKTEAEHLYPVPDLIAGRVDVLNDHRGAAAEMKRFVFAEMIPRWEALSRLPLMAVFLNVGKILPKTEKAAIVAADQSPTVQGKADNKWLLWANQLFAASFSEDAPPLPFRAKVREGQYKALMEVYCCKDYEGHPASSLSVRVEDEPELRTIKCNPHAEKTGKYVLVELGTYDIRDGCFDAVVAQGDRSHWAAFKGFVLVPRSDKAEAEFARLFESQATTQEEIVKTLSVLRALGYVK